MASGQAAHGEESDVEPAGLARHRFIDGARPGCAHAAAAVPRVAHALATEGDAEQLAQALAAMDKAMRHEDALLRQVSASAFGPEQAIAADTKYGKDAPSVPNDELPVTLPAGS